MMRSLLGLIVCVCLSLPAIAEQRIALVIGNEDYPAEVGRLSNPHEDANRIKDSLEAVGFDDIELVLDGDQGQINLAVARFISKLAAAGDEGVGFFYYSGHGASAEAGGVRQNYLIPSRTPITGGEQLPILGVSMNGIVDSAALAQSKAVFIVSDACRNTLPWSTTKGNTGKGFAPVQTRSGLFIAYATADGATAPDDGQFAKSLAAQIRKPQQTASRAFELAFRDVARLRPGNELPFYSPGLLEDVCFDLCPTPGQPGTEPLVDSLPSFDGTRLIRTPSLGLQIVQSGETLPLYAEEKDGQIERVIVPVKRQPFVVRLPTSVWSASGMEEEVVQVAFLDRESVFEDLQVNAPVESTPFLRFGTGVADYEFGSGRLWSNDYEYGDCCPSHNYIVGNRFNASDDAHKGFMVSELFDRDDESNLVESSDAAFLVFYLNKDPSAEWVGMRNNDQLEPGEYEKVELRFVD
ncbi:MAG: caspase family protein [Pseudomonadota bacterium]